MLQAIIPLHKALIFGSMTEQIDILNGTAVKDAAVRVTESVVSFKLQPQYEGTFYCGEVDGEKSNGVGPMAGS